MFYIKIRDSIMIAHSLQHNYFGPAKQLHGATYIIDVSFKTNSLNEFGVVLNLDTAHQYLHEVLEPLKFQNLDNVTFFKDKFSTTEMVAQYIFQELCIKCHNNFKGYLVVDIQENHNCWAGFEGEIC